MLKVSVDYSEFMRSLKQFEQRSGKTVFEGMKELAATASKELATRVKPFGLTTKAKKVAQDAVAMDVSKAYASHGRTFNELKKLSPKKAFAYAAAVNRGDFVSAEKIVRKTLREFSDLVASGDGGAHLERIRGKNGRVENPDRVGITNHTDYGEILEKKIPTAGLVKGAWLACGRQLGGNPKIQTWLRKGQDLATTRAVEKSDGVHISITNQADYASSAIHSKDIVRALKNAERLQLRKLQILLDKAAKAT